jgi:hypothetical protein
VGVGLNWRPGRNPSGMKHATSTALAGITALLDQIRLKAGIKEKKLGIFYRKSKAFLHFHEDPAGLFADLDLGSGFERFPVNSVPEWNALLSAIDCAIAAASPQTPK